MNIEPLEAAAWTLVIIALLFAMGFGVLGVLDFFRAPSGRRGLRLTGKERALLLAMAAATLPPLATALLLHSMSPYLVLAVAAPIAIIVVVISRRLSAQR